jgi:hypothetical protein
LKGGGGQNKRKKKRRKYRKQSKTQKHLQRELGDASYKIAGPFFKQQGMERNWNMRDCSEQRKAKEKTIV